MIMRITWGKLRAGTWQDYERTYHETVAGKAVVVLSSDAETWYMDPEGEIVWLVRAPEPALTEILNALP